MSSRGLALLLAVWASNVAAQPPADAPLRAPDPPPPWQNFAVPALESLALNFGLLAFSNLITQQEWAYVTAESMARNVRLDSWTIDVDRYLTNQFGHAYQGSLTFNTARSSGLGFWWSSLYTLINSLLWETFFESEPPSVGDHLTTPLGGSLLGEVFHRSAAQLRVGTGPKWLRLLGAAVMDPFGAINGELLGTASTRDTALDPMFVRWQFGATAGVMLASNGRERQVSLPQAIIAVLVVSGAPWLPDSTYDTPLSYFDARADLAFPLDVVGNLFIRGLLLGGRFGDQGVWGLFGAYDYAAPSVLRASAVGLGPGVIWQSGPLGGWHLQGGALLAGSPFVAAGETDEPLGGSRDYHVGVGLQASVDARVILPGRFALELTARNWWVFGSYLLPTGFEVVTWVTVAATVPLWRWFGVGAELTLADHRARYDDVEREDDSGFTFRLTFNVLSEPHFGISPQK